MNTSHVLFVEAANAKDAEDIARNYIERKIGIEWFSTGPVSEATPVAEGKVLEN